MNSLTPIIYKLAVLADDLADLPGPAPGAASTGEGGAPNEADRLIQQALEGAERVRIIVRDLNAFSYPDEESLGPVDLWRVLGSSISLVTNQIRHHARLQTDARAVPPVRGNERPGVRQPAGERGSGHPGRRSRAQRDLHRDPHR